MTRKHILWLEWLALFVALPAVLWAMPSRALIFVALWLMAIGSLRYWKKQTQYPLGTLWRWPQNTHGVWASIVARFVVCVLAMTLFTWGHDASRLLGLPQQNPAMWLMIMMLYPLLSVIPQELIYRLFFFERYRMLFPSERAMILASGFAFGHVHLVFNNLVAYGMSMVGGWLFASSYSRHKNFAMLWAEHALYGCFVFTIGLGWYFYSGAQFR